MVSGVDNKEQIDLAHRISISPNKIKITLHYVAFGATLTFLQDL